MSGVRKWLDSIGLAQYTDAFETNDLDIDLLRQVDDQLLKDIGVSSAGHRLRIRNAIAKLAQRPFRPAWTLKTCVSLLAPIRSVSPTPCSASEGSLQSIWAMAC